MMNNAMTAHSSWTWMYFDQWIHSFEPIIGDIMTLGPNTIVATNIHTQITGKYKKWNNTTLKIMDK